MESLPGITSVCKQGFKYDDNGLTFAGFSRDSPKTIKKFLRALDRKDRTRLSSEASRRDKKTWLVSQLRHYGIRSYRRDSRTALEKRLGEAVRARECNRVPDVVVALERNLRSEWKQRPRISSIAAGQPPGPGPQSESHGEPVTPRPNSNKAPGTVEGEPKEMDDGQAQANLNRGDRLAMIPHESLKKKATPRRLSNLLDIAGCYLVKCDEIESGGLRSGLRIDINPGGGHASDFVEAAFDFSILEGIMRLGLDPAFPHSKQSDDADHESNQGDASGTNDPSSEMIVEQPRSEPASVQDGVEMASESRAQNRGPDHVPASQKVYFKWRGSDTSNGAIQLDYGNDNTGWLRFDSKLVTFDGCINIAMVGRSCNLKGFKLSHQARKRAPVWSDFGEQAYDLGILNGWP